MFNFCIVWNTCSLKKDLDEEAFERIMGDVKDIIKQKAIRFYDDFFREYARGSL